MHCITAAPIESRSLEPCTLTMTDSEPELHVAAATETVDASVSESMAEKEDGHSGSPLQLASSDERLSDQEKQQQQEVEEEEPSETSPVEKAPERRPTHIERCSSLDDIKLTKQKVKCSYSCWKNLALYTWYVVKAAPSACIYFQAFLLAPLGLVVCVGIPSSSTI